MVINRLRKGSYIRVSEIIPIRIAEQKIPQLGDLGVDACTDSFNLFPTEEQYRYC